MATQASLDQIQNLFIAFYGRPADAAGQAYWAEALETAGGDLSAIINAFANSAEYDSQYGDLDEAELVNALYQQILGRDAEEDGIDYYVSQLNNGNLTKGEMALAILNGAQNDDAVVLENRKAVADAFTAAVEAGDKEYSNAQLAAAKALLASVNAETDPATVDVDAVVGEFPTVEEPVDPGQPGEEIFLTASTDIMTGTENDDTFLAYMSQNELVGGVSNSLSSADRLDGGEGNDSLYAEIVPEFYGSSGDYQIDVQPRIENIETIEFQARDFGGNINAGGTVTVDAKNIKGVDTIGSTQSDGDLVIENLTTLDNDGGARDTSEMTISMDHTDNFNSDGDASDLTVYFDEDYLIPTESLGESEVIFQIMNQDAYDQNDGENRLDGVYIARMEFSLDGVRYNLADYIEEDEMASGGEFKTEAELVAHLNEVALPALAAANPDAADALNSLEFSIGAEWNDGNQNRVGQSIVLTASNAYELETKDAWVVLGQAEGAETGYASNRIERTSDNPGQDTEELSINIDLHKVGREGEGGDLIVGGKELDDTEGKGIDIFNIDVLGDDKKLSNLGAIASTNSALDVVNIETAAEYVGGDTFASLTIRDGFGVRQDTNGNGVIDRGDLVVREVLDKVFADTFLGDLTIGTDQRVLNLNELQAAGGGDVEFHGDILDLAFEFNGEVLKDTNDEHYSYTTGAGEDTIDLNIDTNTIDRVESSIEVSTAGGDDSVLLNTMTDVNGNGHASQQTMDLFENVSVSTGTGADKVEVTGDIRANIDTGSESDFVYINSQNDTDNTTAFNGTTGIWAFGRESASQAKDFNDQVLYKATLEVTFAGLESAWVSIDTNADGKFIADQELINAAIIKAIDGSPELSKLLEYSLEDGDQRLIIRSTVDGENALEININQPDIVENGATGSQVDLQANDVPALVAGMMQTGVAGLDNAVAANSNWAAADVAAALNLDGKVYQAWDLGGSSDATGAENVNFSIVDLGTGSNDLVVFDSNENSSNVLVINEVFGKNTIVNFHDNAPHAAGGAVVGEHAIDFTHYLNNTVDASNNANNLSETAVAVTLNGTYTANSVNMIVGWAEDTAASQTFGTLTADALLASLNGVTAFGGIAAANPAATANLMGTTQNHIIMVENPNNAGEYKVFHLTSVLDANGAITGADGADFATAVELGILDFGDSINFNLVGSADYAADIEALLIAADQGIYVPPTDVTVTADAASVDEGATVNFALTGEANTAYTYTLGGVDAADVTGGALTGTVTTDANGNASVAVELVADATTEGAETLTLTVDGVSDSVVVNDTSTGPVNPGTQTEVSADLGTDQTAETFDAGTDNFKFTDDASAVNNLIINNFAAGDSIEVTGAVTTDYSITNNGEDVTLIFNNGGTVNQITLVGVVGASDLVYDEASFETAVGFDALSFI